ncbi:MAG TPA: hypothetical protein VII66_09915 [Gemmatimonadaceae bacterium]
MLAELAKRKKSGLKPEPFLQKAAGQSFWNTTRWNMKMVMGVNSISRHFDAAADVGASMDT